MTLAKLIALCGDFRVGANERAIKIVRREPGGRTLAIEIDFDRVIDGEIADPVLQRDDLVFVREAD